VATNEKILERHNKILKFLQKNKIMTINELSSTLKVSKISIRRDLNKLYEKGFIERIQGGATVIRTSEQEPPYIARSSEMKKEKQMIGEYASSIIKENDVISIDVGSTLLELTKNIPEGRNITVITNWIPIVNVLANKKGIVNVFILGGKLNLSELSVVGNYIEKVLDDFNIDIAFLGVGGISPERGLTDYDVEEIQVKKQFIKKAKKTIVLADHSKFGRIAPIKIGDLQIVDQIITSEGLDNKDKIKVEKFGVKVVIAKENIFN